MGGRLPLFKAVSGVFAGGVAVLLLLVYSNWVVHTSTRGYLYSDINKLPYRQVGLLLGTSKYAREGGPNDHYYLRVNAASELFNAGKIDFILISGDNSSRYYNEPSTIRKDLLRLGIPPERIYRDYAGFRTLDSIVRAKSVFGLNEFTVISQTYHNKRAIYIAHSNNINAIAYNAGDGSNSDWQNRGRELMARMLAVIEVSWLKTGPKFLGPMIEIGDTPPT